ncbi:hypothetical protein P154DRAFT_528426 [Amniculicola lignicola CBS 123094]|uniref:Uncharacterized protein n=1 Tax=Amniculicola lignicola CBS 123094 TaxID=1392246 RepID=A0A6A5X4F6_9PLEO|nr:hypothetical protein P154DRAFT_528426 [Amniculicola lignicola CBS 123094]
MTLGCSSLGGCISTTYASSVAVGMQCQGAGLSEALSRSRGDTPPGDNPDHSDLTSPASLNLKHNSSDPFLHRGPISSPVRICILLTPLNYHVLLRFFAGDYLPHLPNGIIAGLSANGEQWLESLQARFRVAGDGILPVGGGEKMCFPSLGSTGERGSVPWLMEGRSVLEALLELGRVGVTAEVPMVPWDDAEKYENAQVQTDL